MSAPRCFVITAALALFFAPFVSRGATTDVPETRPRDLIRIDDVVEIRTDVTGDLYAVGRTVRIDGRVTGDVLAVGEHVRIEGIVSGDVRVVALTADIAAAVAGSITAAGGTITVAPTATVGGNTVFLADHVLLDGVLNGDVRGMMRTGDFRGAIIGDVDVLAETVTLGAETTIGGALTTTGKNEPSIDALAVVTGATTHRATPTSRGSTVADTIFGRVVSFFALMLVGLVLLHLARRYSFATVSMMTNLPAAAFAWGAATLVVTPLLALLLMVTIIGIPLGGMLMGLWLTTLYLARVMTGLAVGLHVFWHVDQKRRTRSVAWPLAVGLALLIVFETIPYLWLPVFFASIIWGLGGIALLTKELVKPLPQKAHTHHDDKDKSVKK